MGQITDIDILKYALENGMIDKNVVQSHIEMREKEKYLKMHQSKVWKSTDQYWYTYIEMIDGKKKLVKRKQKAKLEEVIIEHYKSIENAQTLDLTFHQWIEKKLKFQEITLQTAERYEIDFYKFFGDYRYMEMKDVTEEFLEDFILDNILKYNLKRKAFNGLKTILKGMMLFALKRHYTAINIVDFLSTLELSRKLFNTDKKPDEQTIFSDSELDILEEYLLNSTGLSNYAILVAMYTGMRVGEVVALKWEDIGDEFIHVNRSQVKYTDGNGNAIYEIKDSPKTEAGIRDIVIIPKLKPVIKRLRCINPFEEYVFYNNATESVITKNSVMKRLNYICYKFNFKSKGMHSLRRTYATKLINAGVENSIIKSQMGHADITTTMQYYYKNNFDKEDINCKIINAIG